LNPHTLPPRTRMASLNHLGLFFGVNNRGVSLWKKPTCPTQSRQGIIIQTKTVWATPLWCANLNGQNTYALFLRNNPPKPDTPILLRRRRQFPCPHATASNPNGESESARGGYERRYMNRVLRSEPTPKTKYNTIQNQNVLGRSSFVTQPS